jgi:hypothetical protein
MKKGRLHKLPAFLFLLVAGTLVVSIVAISIASLPLGIGSVLANFVNSKLKEQKTLVKSFVTEEDKVLKGVEHKLNVIIRSYKRFDSEAFRKDQPEVYNDYKTKVVSSMELKPLIDAEQESELLTENFPLMQIQLQSST